VEGNYTFHKKISKAWLDFSKNVSLLVDITYKIIIDNGIIYSKSRNRRLKIPKFVENQRESLQLVLHCRYERR